MKKEAKICLPVYKMAYAVLFVLLLSMVRGISDVSQIGVALDPNMALLAVVFCADTYVMEYHGKRWEIFTLLPLKSKVGAIRRRLGTEAVFLCSLSYAGYWFFYWQRPNSSTLMGSPALFYGMYILAVSVTVLFWGILSQTIVNLCKNLWGGIGITVSLWLLINSKLGDQLLGRFNVFAFAFRDLENTGDWSWLWGKGAALICAAVMFAIIPIILKKRG